MYFKKGLQITISVSCGIRKQEISAGLEDMVLYIHFNGPKSTTEIRHIHFEMKHQNVH